MTNSKITHKITQGMYILTTEGGGCVVDAVSRAGGSSDAPLISVSIAKNNKTNELLQRNSRFALSVLGENANPALITNFGFKSSRSIDKYADCQTRDVEGIKIIEESIGYMVFEKVDSIDCDTHTLFIGKMITGDILDDKSVPMTYAYYQEHKSDLKKVETSENKTAWICTVCGYVYYGDEVPSDYRCPLCGLGKEYFKKKEV